MALSIGSIPLLLSLALLVTHTLMRCADCSRLPNAATCIGAEREALLKFRHSLVDDSSLLSSWVGDDCCSWKGVSCSKRTGHVVVLDLRNPCVVPVQMSDPFGPSFSDGNCSLTGQVHPSLIELRHLKYLDLSWNNFSTTKFPAFLASLPNLVYLNLSNARFSGKIPLHLRNISALQYLDLNNNNNYGFLTIENLEWVSYIPSLKHLDMSRISVRNGVDWWQSVTALTSLQFLGLAGCSLPSIDPTLHVNFTSLEFLDLSYNTLGSKIPLSLLNLSSVTHLDLSSSFQGSLSFPTEIIDNNRELAFLDLSFNSIRGELPKNLSNLPRLFALKLAGNNLAGDISAVLGNTSGGFDSKLRYLDLSVNKISGHLGDEIGWLKSLEFIDLAYNSIEGPIPESLVELSSLRYLRLFQNKMMGGIPGSIGKMSNLMLLDLSDNLLGGVVTQLHLANLANLMALDISSNYELAVEISPAWVPIFQLQAISMSNCKVGPQFPTWLQSQRNIGYLDLSNASISDIIPDWFYNISSNIQTLDLSENELLGQFPEDLGDMMPQASNLKLSGNYLNGSIPSSMCKMKGLYVLDLSNNRLSGRLPNCWESSSYLQAINLGNNRLNSLLPTSMCSLKELTFLGMHNNDFYGKLPECLTDMTSLEVLDLSHNNFAGRIPMSIGRLLSLRILNLEVNTLKGDIPTGICELANLQVLNLAHNNLYGSIPLCFDNLTAMTDQISNTSNRYWFGVEVNIKSTTQEYTSTLQYLFSIDLSSNDLTGQLPQGMTELYNLQNLNLSQNHIIGRIPSSISDLKKLESLDLSTNRFSGPIPPSISKLNFLSFLNLSNNQLSGPIPSGSQLHTFRDDSYLRNSALCGPPLSRSCRGDHEQPDTPEQHSDDTIWLYAGIAPGFTTGLLGVCGSLYFKRSWRQSFNLWSDKIVTQLLMMVQIGLAQLNFSKMHREPPR